MLGSKISNAPENNSFAASFMHLKLRRGTNKDNDGEAGEGGRKQDRDWITG